MKSTEPTFKITMDAEGYNIKGEAQWADGDCKINFRIE
jgi:hypothetical protein